MPVVFLFNSKEVLTRQATRFSTGNLGANAPEVGDSADFYCELPFERIYHDSSLYGYDDGYKKQIIYNRHAEVIVPDALDLGPLRRVWCRSEAERETLLNLLTQPMRKAWKNRIGVGTKNRLFYEDWPFVDSAELTAKKVSFRFHPVSNPSGPFHAHADFRLIDSGRKYIWDNPEYTLGQKLGIRLIHAEEQLESYEVKLTVDGNLAYFGRYIHLDDELPF